MLRTFKAISLFMKRHHYRLKLVDGIPTYVQTNPFIFQSYLCCKWTVETSMGTYKFIDWSEVWLYVRHTTNLYKLHEMKVTQAWTLFFCFRHMLQWMVLCQAFPIGSTLGELLDQLDLLWCAVSNFVKINIVIHCHETFAFGVKYHHLAVMLLASPNKQSYF